MRCSTSAAPRPRRDRSARSAPPSARRWRPAEALRGRRALLACASACALRRRASHRTRRDAQRGGRARCAAIAARGTAEGAAKRSARPAPPVARGWRRRPRQRLDAQGACSEGSGTGVVSTSARAQGCTARPTRSRLQVASPAAGRHTAIGCTCCGAVGVARGRRAAAAQGQRLRSADRAGERGVFSEQLHDAVGQPGSEARARVGAHEVAGERRACVSKAAESATSAWAHGRTTASRWAPRDSVAQKATALQPLSDMLARRQSR